MKIRYKIVKIIFDWQWFVSAVVSLPLIYVIKITIINYNDGLFISRAGIVTGYTNALFFEVDL